MIDLQLVWMYGILSGLFFILNFATCYSMPWASKCPGEDKCKKNCPHRKPLCEHHKPLAWLTVLTGVFHIIVSVIWYFGL
ncbi:MAG: hypothetical protein PHU12_01820 [Candidatus Aenigmarchaeota archaeon]|nr:hypothetical protein [Candidatus Aenigmarchaeota archaeon]